jgi:Undecaprenyl-phosphate glucose phosphotransferase
MRSKDAELLYLYLFFDLMLLNIALWVVLLLFGHSASIGPLEWYYYVHGNAAWIVTFFVFPKKNLYLRDGFSNRFLRITRRTMYFVVISLLLAFLTYRMRFSLRLFVSYALLLWLLKIVFYWCLYRYLRRVRNGGEHIKRCVIVNQGRKAERLRRIMDINPILGYGFLGYIVSDNQTEGEEVFGTVDDFPQLAAEHRIEMVFLSMQMAEDIARYRGMIEFCRKNGIQMRYVVDTDNWNRLGGNSETMMGIPLINPLVVPLDSIWNRFWKRVVDVVFSLLVIVCIFSWLFPILALIIKLSSKGPVLFAQQRTGLNNHTFTCYKFRSMRPNKDSDSLQATIGDQRITCIGRIMRKTNMDEFPQFFNVLFGQMSVVGPRPHMLAHTEQYSALIDTYLQRHFVKPGITGWAQVNGLRGETDELWKMERRVEYDMEYVKNWSMWLDAKIVVLTIFGRNSYHNAH